MRHRVWIGSGALALLACSGVGEVASNAEDLGRLAQMLDDPEGYAAAVEAGCEQGVPRDCAALGVHYAFATYGRERDYAKAHQYLRIACDGGEAQGCLDLGVLYQYGRGVAEDRERARELFEVACAAEIANGCHYVGDYYAHGYGPGGDDAAQASRWYQQACDHGSQSSCDR